MFDSNSAAESLAWTSLNYLSFTIGILVDNQSGRTRTMETWQQRNKASACHNTHNQLVIRSYCLLITCCLRQKLLPPAATERRGLTSAALPIKGESAGDAAPCRVGFAFADLHNFTYPSGSFLLTDVIARSAHRHRNCSNCCGQRSVDKASRAYKVASRLADLGAVTRSRRDSL